MTQHAHPHTHIYLAPAKINLFLHVTGRRADGYHLLESLAVFADCGERVTLRPAARTVVTATGPFAAALPQDGTDSLSRAVAGFGEVTGAPFPCAVHVHKAIPAGAGLGGGSADAAAVLRGLGHLSGRTVRPGGLSDLAIRIGADVPVCLASTPMMMRGIGEVLTPCVLHAPLFAVLIHPGVPVATPLVFKQVVPPYRPALPVGIWDRLTPTGLRDLMQATANDLEPVAMDLCPVIRTVLAALAAQPGCWAARMTGSGSACFGLFTSPALATAACQQLTPQFDWVQAVQITGAAPDSGAQACAPA